MKQFFVALLLVFSATATLAETLDAQNFFDQNLGDFKAELGSAKKAGKIGVLLMFEQEGCPFCHRMRETVLDQLEVQNYLPGGSCLYLANGMDFQSPSAT